MQELSAHTAQTHAEAHAIHRGLPASAGQAGAMKAGRLQIFKKRKTGSSSCVNIASTWGSKSRGDRTSVGLPPSDGSLKEVMKYLLNIATRFTGDLPSSSQ
jgi:hypothetical protein